MRSKKEIDYGRPENISRCRGAHAYRLVCGVSEETGDEIIVMKNKDSHVIDFEKLNYIETSEPLQIAFKSLQNA